MSGSRPGRMLEVHSGHPFGAETAWTGGHCDGCLPLHHKSTPRVEPGVEIGSVWISVPSTIACEWPAALAASRAGDRAEHWVYVSFGNAHASHATPDADESAAPLAPTDRSKADRALYGEAKVACEQASTAFVVTASSSHAPVSSATLVQVVDVRDLLVAAGEFVQRDVRAGQRRVRHLACLQGRDGGAIDGPVCHTAVPRARRGRANSYEPRTEGGPGAAGERCSG
jgi:hypothetical protein